MKKLKTLILFLLVAICIGLPLCDAKDTQGRTANVSDIKIVNAGFENNLSGWLAPNPGVCDTSISTKKFHHGNKSVCLQDDTGVTWCLVQRILSVPPGKYKVEISCLLEGGRAFLWLESIDSRNKVVAGKRSDIISSQMLNPLVPDFVAPRLVRGYKKRGWQLLDAEIEVRQAEKLRIRFGSYFMPGVMYFDDLSVKKLDK